MNDHGRHGIAGVWLIGVLLSTAAGGQGQPPAESPPVRRADQEAFLRHARIIETREFAGQRYQKRVTLDDGRWRHDASAEIDDGTSRFRRHYRHNVAAYELDKVLDLRLVAPTVARTVNGRPMSLTWWVDGVIMSEQARRARSVAFRVCRRLEFPEGLTRCSRQLLERLRALDHDTLERALGSYLQPAQLDALAARRQALVTHFDDEIVRRGERAVLYDVATPP